MKIATWNINECVGITCDLDNQKTTDKINVKNIKCFDVSKLDNFSDHYIMCANISSSN